MTPFLDDDDFFDDDGTLDDMFKVDESMYETKNSYLTNAEKGLKLVSSLLLVSDQMKRQLRDIRRLDHLIDERLLQSIHNIQLKDEVQLYEQLVKLSDRLFEQNKLRLLKNKVTVGIGGQFSAGKSKFINSIMDAEILPEDQVPTTSIATYLVKGSALHIQAYATNDQVVSLDTEAVQALSHEFYRTYELGFSQFIRNIVISTPTFPYEAIALLDTPGYSKSDSSKKQELSDTEKALVQLKAVDYLIWLIDVENGVIKKGDLAFIESLQLTNPILIVFNKADKIPESKLQAIINHTKETLDKTKLPIFDVIGYSASSQKEYFTNRRLQAFFNHVEKEPKRYRALDQEISSIIKQLENQIEQHDQLLVKRRNELGDYIFRSQNVNEVRSLTEVYASVLQELKETQSCKYNLRRTKEQIQKQFSLLQTRGAL